ncbi:IclR family transcriptional regulator [Frigidibacter sp. ROC022]|uniref:IclR family transcriptional regulator n=1 Tax=Frigidibacter sp. ROC022 TaxID=2971796 RepID=UPI00215B4B87|nr:IclR family transcriptional regulator [Frigidibacter sp. ROC022]MCR8724083.1 IclR family transcriptional regulator [Frigidibacter sp. ROC022]
MRKRSPAAPLADDEDDAGGDRQFVTALHRGLEVLRAFRPDDNQGLGNREIAERTGLPNSTISRLTYTLLKLGYLVYDDTTGRYRVGVPVLSLGLASLGGSWLRDIALPRMQQLADACGDGIMVALGGRDGMSMTYVACARAAGVISLQLNVGSRISLTRSAMGRAYIAAAAPGEREQILAQLRERTPPEDLPRILDGIEDARQQIASRGFYANIGQWKPDVNAVSVPYLSPQVGNPPMAFNLGGPAYLLPPERLQDEFGPRLLELVRAVSRL